MRTTSFDGLDKLTILYVYEVKTYICVNFLLRGQFRLSSTFSNKHKTSDNSRHNLTQIVNLSTWVSNERRSINEEIYSQIWIIIILYNIVENPTVFIHECLPRVGIDPMTPSETFPWGRATTKRAIGINLRFKCCLS